MKIFVGCSSRDNIPGKYYDKCYDLLSKLFSNNFDLVFGACNKGLMGLAYKAALSNNSDIIGIYPDAYVDEAKDLNIVDIPVKTVSDRTDMVIKESDILLFLPGGIGTVYDLFTAIESKRAGEHNKPIIIYNVDGFYDKLVSLLSKMSSEKFINNHDFKNNFYIFDSIDCLLDHINKYIIKEKELSRKREY